MHEILPLLTGGKFVSQGNVVSLAAPYGAWPYFTYFAKSGSGGLVAVSGISHGGGGYRLWLQKVAWELSVGPQERRRL